MKSSLFFAGLLTVLCSGAWAGQGLSFPQLREACTNPGKYHNQIQPTNIKLDCSDRQLTWILSGEDQLTLVGQRTVGHAVTSDKYSVALTKEQINLAPTVVACPVMKQVEETIAISQTLTCDQVVNFQGSATEMCAQIIDQMRTGNPAGIVRKETGKEIHPCSQNSAGGGEDQGQRGQR